MNFTLTEEQRLIQNTARTFLADVWDSAAVRAAAHGDPPQLWTRIAQEMGWAAMPIPEQDGGLGLGCVEIALLQEEMGYALFSGPWFSTICLSLPVVCAAAPHRKDILEAIASGEMTVALAFMDEENSGAAPFVYRDSLSGEASHVIEGAGSSHILALALESEDSSFFLFPADTPGVTVEGYGVLDATRPRARVRCKEVSLPEETRLGSGSALEAGLIKARVALAAEQVGVAQRTLDMAVEHAKTRIQFNQPIGAFQAVQHKCADMLLGVETARSAAFYAACLLEAEAPEARAATLGAAAYCGEVGFDCAAQAIQIHGGIGFTWEHDLHFFFKRARANEALLGTPREHKEQIARLVLDGAEA